MTSVLVIDKQCSIKEISLKKYNEHELYKKCGFKKEDGFNKEGEWSVKMDKQNFVVFLYGKVNGRATHENKYDFPPPADNILLFGSCLLICFKKNETEPCSLTTEMWDKMYEKLFGGFEDLAATQAEDDNEEDELANVPNKFKTKSGYLKDGFIVSDGEESSEKEEGSSSQSCTDSNGEESSDVTIDDALLGDLLVDDVESELYEEEYELSSDDEIVEA